LYKARPCTISYMSQRKFAFAEHEFYHLYNRGNSKQVIFQDQADYRRFQQLLYVMNTDAHVAFRLIDKKNPFVDQREGVQVAIGAYCLMPNHFHLLVTPLCEGGVEHFMQRLSTSYSMYFNKRYERTGALFEGRFKAQLADSDEYLKYLYAYIHLNPVKLIDPEWKERGSKDAAKSFDFAASFAYSSLPDYLGVSRPESGIIEPSPFPAYFATAADMKSELFEWLNFTEVSDLGKTTP
jgi:putative transposase